MPNNVQGTQYPALGIKNTLASRDDVYTSDDFIALSFPGATNVTVATTALTANANATYANVTGLSQVVQPGTYRFRAVLPSTVASGTGGIKYSFNYTGGLTLTSIEATAKGFTASAVAVQHTTTTTTQTDLFTQAAIVILTEIEGAMVVSATGTVNLQMAQNTSNGSNTIALIGGTLTFIRIA